MAPRSEWRPATIPRNNWRSNRSFASYDDIVDHYCHAWNKLTDQRWHQASRLGAWVLIDGRWY
jgi:hypothetical protein